MKESRSEETHLARWVFYYVTLRGWGMLGLVGFLNGET